jgi:hypothetical protein
MDSIDRLIQALWNLYVPDIASGQPVYFCFCQDSVREALKQAGIASDSPLNVICDAATRCFDITARHVILREDALSGRADGRSMAIVLVCQQVLAVETMVDDGRVSRNAYFPRLRELMSGELRRDRQCPLSTEDFVQIWRTFQREIKRCEGCTAETVTFQFGRYKGSNKARGFPFSQALLSRADLMSLQRRGRRDKLLSRRKDEAWRELRGANRYLSRRAQKLISEGSLHEEILDQVRQFLERTPVPAAQAARRAEAHLLQLGIGIEPDYIFNEQFFAFLQRKGTSTPIEDDDAAIHAKLEDILPADGYVFCPPSETDDYWLFEEREVTVTAGRSFVVVARGFGIQRARAILDGVNPSLDVPEERWRTLGLSDDIRACRIELPQTSSLEITLRAGRIAQSRSSVSTAYAFTWLGGICVDLRARKYLREALPEAVRFGPARFAISDVVGVGGQSIGWSGLKQRLDRLETDATLDLCYPNGNVARLSIAVMPRSMPARVGFLIESDGTVGTRLQPINDGAHALIGYSETAARSRPLSVAELGQLVRELRIRKKSPHSEDERRALVDRVEVSGVPSILKSLIMKHLKSGV